MTVSNVVAGLIADSLLDGLGSPTEDKIGKPATLVGLLADAAYIVTLDLSPDDRMTGAVVGFLGHVKARAEMPLEGACDEEAVRLAAGLAERLRGTIDRPVLGVGSRGVVDGHGVVLDAHNLYWAGVDLTGILSRRIDPPVYAANDANTAVLAEYTFGGTSAADLMLLRIGIGVGAGLVVGGAFVQGHAWATGEVGHVVTDPARVRCTCGKAGCLETVVAISHLRHGDRLLASTGIVLGQVLAPVVVLNLHEVVLAGPPDLFDGELCEALNATIRGRVMVASAADLVVRMSLSGDDVVLIGAAVLVLSGELGVL